MPIGSGKLGLTTKRETELERFTRQHRAELRERARRVYAAAALNGLLAGGQGVYSATKAEIDTVTAQAFDFADAMLEQEDEDREEIQGS